ncbi:Mrp/NBP35 family ATP-binding protein [Lagierella sp.]|uniref:Mrp/NBP35 family ATP-binding protein n=1 Tax=Lagierella sp. TaxID=2849657 RepID=UPI0026026534|nr:Mrp/NBP35 family ATP-binding protein [Lagierella sp.]
MSNCNSNCSGCSKSCGQRTAPENFKIDPNETTKIGKIIGVVSGKGGVGKSLVTSMLASDMAKKGYKVGIMDADITGPSIPKYFGIKENATSDGQGNIYPVTSENGIKIISINLLLENETDPVVWRGPVVAGVIKQFYQDVLWEELDYLFIDLPPGTGDVPLTIFQSLPIDGIVVVTTPNELVEIIVKKAIKMAKLMGVEVLGLVENMSYLKCPSCDETISIFGESKIEKISKELNINTFAKVPVDPAISHATESGKIYSVDKNYLYEIVERLEVL